MGIKYLKENKFFLNFYKVIFNKDLFLLKFYNFIYFKINILFK